MRKKYKILLTAIVLVVVVTLPIGMFFYINTPTEVNISLNKEDIEVGEVAGLNIEVKNRIGKAMNIDESKLVISSTAGENISVNELNFSFSETGIFSIEVSYGGVSSNAIIVDVFKNPLGMVVDRTAISETNINPKIYFQLKHDFTFNNYNFEADYSINPLAWSEEYTLAYNNFYNGNAEEKQTAIDKIGNDILIKFTVINGEGEEVVVSSKTKAWEGYLNFSDGISDPSPQKLEGQNLTRTLPSSIPNKYYSTAINLSPETYLNKGHTLRVEIAIIEENKSYENFFEIILAR